MLNIKLCKEMKQNMKIIMTGKIEIKEDRNKDRCMNLKRESYD
jgi:hypothetical protein